MDPLSATVQLTYLGKKDLTIYYFNQTKMQRVSHNRKALAVNTCRAKY